MRVSSIAQRLPSTRPLRPLLLVLMDGTILMASARRLSACGLPNKKLRRPVPCALIIPLRASQTSHCTTESAQKASICVAPDPRPWHPIPLALGASLHAALERQQRTSSVKRMAFMLVEAWHTNTSTAWLALRSILILLIKRRGSNRKWRRTKKRCGWRTGAGGEWFGSGANGRKGWCHPSIRQGGRKPKASRAAAALTLRRSIARAKS